MDQNPFRDQTPSNAAPRPSPSKRRTRSESSSPPLRPAPARRPIIRESISGPSTAGSSAAGPSRASNQQDNLSDLGILGLSQEPDNGFLSTSYPLSPEEDIDTETRAANLRELAAADTARALISNADISAIGIQPTNAILFSDPTPLSPIKRTTKRIAPTPRKDFFSSLSSYPELLFEIAKFLSPKSLLKLYSISKDFHETLNGHLAHAMISTATHQAPESAKIFAFKLYASLCIPDPTGRSKTATSTFTSISTTSNSETRLVPGLKWLQQTIHREKTIRDILALMARQGHRMPRSMSLSLKKMWLIMDVATSAGRVAIMHSKLITENDIYNMQMFMLKLDMRFNDPIDGPGSDALRKLFLGQKGLTPLKKLLAREQYLDYLEVKRLQIRYYCEVRAQHRHLPLFGVQPAEIGVGHLEGWGRGRAHLLRPDELVVREAVRRALGLKEHLMGMMLWGYVDLVTGKDIKLSEEEMYMSDEEERRVDPYWNDYEEREVEEVEEVVEDEDDDDAWEDEEDMEMVDA